MACGGFVRFSSCDACCPNTHHHALIYRVLLSAEKMPKARNLRYYHMALALLVSNVTINALVTDCAERHPKLMEDKRVHGKEAIRLVVCGHPQDKQ